VLLYLPIPGVSLCQTFLHLESVTAGNAEVLNIWNDCIVPLIDSFQWLAETLGKDIMDMFKNNKKMSQEQLFAKSGSNLVVSLIDIVKKIIKTIVSLASKLVSVLKEVGNLR